MHHEDQRIRLDFLQVVTGKNLKPMASLRLNIAGELFDATASGNGPVDAAIKAVQHIITRKIVLEEFLIQAITGGSDDVGKVHMQITHDQKTYYGFGVNTDIITASVEAYLDAINKIKNQKTTSSIQKKIKSDAENII